MRTIIKISRTNLCDISSDMINLNNIKIQLIILLLIIKKNRGSMMQWWRVFNCLILGLITVFIWVYSISNMEVAVYMSFYEFIQSINIQTSTGRDEMNLGLAAISKIVAERRNRRIRIAYKKSAFRNNRTNRKMGINKMGDVREKSKYRNSIKFNNDLNNSELFEITLDKRFENSVNYLKQPVKVEFMLKYYPNYLDDEKFKILLKELSPIVRLENYHIINLYNMIVELGKVKETILA